MLLIRVLGLLAAIALGGCVAMYLATGQRKYLNYAWTVFRGALFVAVLVLVLLFGERLLGVV